jgi:catechol 2,3-dioxygenase-like lactoylglutathione lyase family enzyme
MSKLFSNLKTLHCRRNEAFSPAMKKKFQASRDVIVRTKNLKDATKFYKSVLGLPVTMKSKTLMGFETGSFCLYVEQGDDHGPVFEFLVPDLKAAKKKLLAFGCEILEENPEVPRCYIRDPYGMIFNIGEADSE